MIDEKNIFDQPVKSDMTTFGNIHKIATAQGDDYTTGCLLDYNYLKKYYKMIVIDLSKQQALDADPKAIQQINFTGNLERDNAAIMYFTIIRLLLDYFISSNFFLLGRLLGTLPKTGLPLIGNVLKPLAKSVLTPLGLTGAASATDVAIHKKMFESGHPLGFTSGTTTLVILNEEMNDIMKIVKALKYLVYE